MDDYTPFDGPGVVRVRGAHPVLPRSSRRLSVPVAQTHKYSRADWEASLYSLFAEGADPPPCPECGRTGFFGPRFSEPNLRFRSCRFCGFWQEVGCLPEFHLPTVHDCLGWPRVSKADYLWWVTPETESYPCPFCGDRVDVPLSLASGPVGHQEHPWWHIPQNKSQSIYRRLWSYWKFTAGRTIL